MKDTNICFLIGRLTRDIELKYTVSGMAVANISIANNDSYKSGEERKDVVSFFDIEVFGTQAINCEKYLKKGSLIAVSGRIVQQRWQDKTTQQTRSKVIIKSDSVQFLDNKSDNPKIDNNENINYNNPENDPWNQ